MERVNYRKVIQYVFMFLLFFLCLQFFYEGFLSDRLYSFGFSYAISKGEIPYRDFNMIITPFGAYFYAIPFLIFGSHMIVFNLFQALLLCIMFYFLFKMYGSKAWLLFIILFFVFPIPIPSIMTQGYNFLLLLELVILLYLEKNKCDDYLIGLVIGLSFLTKQNVGFFLALPSFYYLFKEKNYKKVLKRVVAFLSINILFVIYLFITKSFSQFIDLCFLGMFGFTKNNGTIFDINFIIFLGEIICILIFIIKDKNDINNYYILAFSMIAIPLFDLWHVALFSYAFLFLLFSKIRFKEYKNICFCSLLFTYFLSITWFLSDYNFKLPNLSQFRGFEYYIMSLEEEEETKRLVNYISNNKSKNIIILSDDAYFLKIINNLDITYYDLLNYGNHGYNGTEKIIKEIKNEDMPIFIINSRDYNNLSRRFQFNKEVVRYVLNNYKSVDTIGDYLIYE